MLKKRLLASFIAAVLAITAVCSAPVSALDTDDVSTGLIQVAQNDKYTLFADMQTAGFELLVNASSKRFSSNLTREQTALDEIAKAKFKRNMESQIILNYRDVALKQELTLSSGTLKANDIKTSSVSGGFSATYSFDKIGIELTLEYLLDSNGLVAKLRNNSIKETNKAEFTLVSVEVLPNFGSASVLESGYMLVPDGCGALIYLNNGKTNVASYSQRIYGEDKTQSFEKKSEIEQTARLPVYGIKTENSAFIAIIEEGAAQSEIKASVSGNTTSYNSVYGNYIIRNSDLYSIGNSSSATTHRIYQDKFDKDGVYSVRFIPVESEELDYSSMAQAYKQYLKETFNIKSKDTDRRTFVELYGAAEAQKTFLGIPYRSVVPLTTYQQVGKIAKKLNEGGIEQLLIQYTDWDNGNIKSRLPDKLRLSNELGGKKEFNKMLKSLKKQKNDIYLNLDFINFTYSGNGFRVKRDSADLLSKTTALQKKFLLSTLYEDKEAPWSYLSSLSALKESTEGYYKSIKSLNVQGIAMASMGEEIYSDYSSLDSSRSKTEKAFKKAADLYSNNKALSTSGGNAYMLPFAEFISSVPIEDSNFDITDEEIPFYQLSLSGIIGMSTPAVNQNSDPDKIVLKAIEYGISLGFIWYYNDPYILKNTDSNNLYGASFEGWRKEAIKYNNLLKDAEKGIGNGVLKSHKNINNKVSMSTFENGCSILVNYGEAAFTDQNGNTAEPMSYCVIGEQLI